MINDLENSKKFWKGKRVFLTGHTGFKGIWFSIILNSLGAKIIGYSLKPTKQNLFFSRKIEKIFIKSIYADIRDYKKLYSVIIASKPEIIVHMAAQPLVIDSYNDPKYNYDVNIGGTINLLNASINASYLKALLVVTTDKVYENKETGKSFVETDRLGGNDPYSTSKACKELIVNSYYKSFFEKKEVNVATARSGNVIGGGDLSKDRVVPDFIRSLNSKKIYVRNPSSIRPWQHVIDPLMGYKLLLENLYKRKSFSGAWNFGPIKKSCIKVSNLFRLLNYYYFGYQKVLLKFKKQKFKESKILFLSSKKSKKYLKWKSKYDIKDTTKLTIDWYKNYFNKKNIIKFSEQQVENYFNKKGKNYSKNNYKNCR